jgi:hypothetical protein
MQREFEKGMVFETCPISKSVVKKIRCVEECINQFIFGPEVTKTGNQAHTGLHLQMFLIARQWTTHRLSFNSTI